MAGRGTYTLLDARGRAYRSAAPGTLGGHRRSRIYGRLDCPAARRAIGRGGYVAHRVFFADESTARSAGYRPCAVCLPERYRQWRHRHPTTMNRSETPAATLTSATPESLAADVRAAFPCTPADRADRGP